MAKTRKKTQSLEDQLLRLEEILDALDAGEEPLETMIGLYDEGMHLVRDARATLEQAELRITTIRDSMEQQDEDDESASDEDA